MVVISLGWWKD